MSNGRESKSSNSNFDYVAQIGAITLLAFMILTVLLFSLGNKTVYESKTFLAIINIIFLSALPFAVAYISSFSYLRSGLLQLLFLGGAMVTFGICNLIAAWGILSVTTPEWTNFLVTVHNSGVLVFGIVTFTASILSSIKTSRFNPNSKNRKLSVALAYATATILAILLAALTLAQDTPPFVVLGEFTLLRQSILVIVVVLLFASAFLFGKKYFDTKSRIVYWYALGLGLVGMGILGILIEPHLGTPLSWTGRAAQYVGCVFFVIAALSKLPKSGVGESWVEAFRSDRLQLSNLFSKMLDGFAYHKIETDDQGKPTDYVFLEVNDAFERVTGLKRENIIGKKATQAIPGIEKDPADWIGVYGHVALTGEPTQFENYALPLDRWFRVSAYCPERGYFVALFEDITARKKAEAAVQQSELRYRGLFGAVAGGIVVQDQNGSIIEANDTACEILGLSRGQMQGRSSTDPRWHVIHEDNSPFPGEEHPAMITLKTGEAVRNVVMGVFHPNSLQYRWVLINSEPIISTSEKNIVAAVTTFVDITNLKKTEEALRENEHLYRTVFDNSQDGFQLIELVYDKNGKPIDHKFLKVNHAYEKIIGVKAEDILDKTAKYISPNVEPNWLEVPDRVAKTGISEHVELYNKDINKTLDCYYFLYSKDIVGTLFRDITGRKQLEKQLQDSERLAAIGTTAGMVGHDIRNPLQAITGDVYLAKTELDSIPESDEKKGVLESLQEIEKNTEYINKIVADLQDFARPLKPNTEETDLKLIIEELLKKNVLPENVKVSVKVEPDARNVVADHTFINRIMYNLVNNAVQAMPDGGKLTIHSFKEANVVIISVKDTGVGIPEAVRGKLFTPMFTTKAKGQGFGLAVIKRMTESLGGTVTFESQEGKGTTFIVRLPQSPQQQT
jgi:PAS domain S-box-containing protein